jgi:hypothetical protein
MKTVGGLFFVLCTILVTNLSHAQWKVGAIGGWNYSNARREAEPKGRTLFCVGGIVEYDLSERYSLIVEPMYMGKGFIKNLPVTEPEMTVTAGYLEFPLFLKFRLPIKEFVRSFFVVGSSLGYRLKSEVETTISGIPFKADLKNVTVPLDICLCAGGGLEIPFKSFSTFIECRYSYGLIDQRKNGNFQATGNGYTITGTVTDKEWMKYTGIQLMAGIMIPL